MVITQSPPVEAADASHVGAVGRADRDDRGGPVRPVRTRRPRAYLAAGLALIIAGGLGSALLYTSASHTVQMLVVSHHLQRGEVIASRDLTSIGVAQGQSTSGVPAANSSTVIGKVATVDLPTGSLLTTGAFAPSLNIPTGKALVGLSLKPSQLPAQPLAAGERIVIVPVAAEGQPAPTSSTSVTGIVSDTAKDQASGATVVDVYVSQTLAADLTSRAAAGAVAIYLTAPAG